ncbi:MAG: hypothetical protein ACYTE1_08645, partial [Planctomycetota bacterium]
EFLGFSPRLALIGTPLVVVVILLALQVTSKTPWRVKFEDLFLMAGECVLLTVPLIVLSLLLNREPPVTNMAALAAQVVEAPNLLWVDIVTGIGAGIYEELIFRLVLICLLMLLFQDLSFIKATSSRSASSFSAPWPVLILRFCTRSEASASPPARTRSTISSPQCCERCCLWFSRNNFEVFFHSVMPLTFETCAIFVR